nr:glycosyltransferase domain-containing protein [uncultured Lelliottia sp.]
MLDEKKLVVYTVITGQYDDINELPFITDSRIKYICFTNNKSITSNSWQIKYINDDISNHMLNRKIKFFPHVYLKNYDYSLYIDGNIIIKKDLFNFFKKYCTKDLIMALPNHLDRTCIYSEASICKLQKKDEPSKIDSQMEDYRREGFPINYGLFENNIILRNHNSADLNRIMESWWGEINKYSKRDQLSLCYCLWKNNVKITTLVESSRIKNPYFDIALHKAYETYGFIKKVIVLIDMKKHYNKNYKFANSIINILRIFNINR